MSTTHPSRRLSLALLLAAAPSPVLAVPDMRFDVVTFANANTEGAADHMNQTLFNDLNFADQNGHVIAMGGDTHRPELNAAGNTLGSYYNSWTNIYNGQTTKSGAAAADTIAAYVNGFTTTGPAPNWVVLNELSGSLWQDATSKGDTYRQWVVDCVTRLHETYGLNVIAYSPFPNPGAHADTWRALSAEAYIGVENYLSGAVVKSHNFSLSWVQSQYASSITSYANLGVPKSRLILGEDFANTDDGTGYGRDGVSAADWEATIRVRSQAIYNLNFAGFIGYAWSKNGMGLSDADMLYAEDVYRSTMVLPSERPQWILPAGGSWSARNNWLAYASVPNNPGDVATFNPTFSAPATITLDGNHTVGSLTLNSPNSLTLAQGTGGTLTFDNNSATPSITVSQGSHRITAPLAFASPAALTIAANAQLDITTNTLSLSSSATPVATLRQYLHDALLISSTANADPQHRLALGYLLNPDSSITVRTTYLGDANLDGLVNADDYALLDRSFARHLTNALWSDGDFNNDGQVTSADYLLIDRTYALQSGPFSPDLLAERESQFGPAYVQALLTSIPEPSALALISLALPLLSHRLTRHPRPTR